MHLLTFLIVFCVICYVHCNLLSINVNKVRSLYKPKESGYGATLRNYPKSYYPQSSYYPQESFYSSWYPSSSLYPGSLGSLGSNYPGSLGSSLYPGSLGSLGPSLTEEYGYYRPQNQLTINNAAGFNHDCNRHRHGNAFGGGGGSFLDGDIAADMVKYGFARPRKTKYKLVAKYD